MKPLQFCILYAFLTVFMLETINYLEHYGLERKPLEYGPNGEVTVWESVTIMHSWNAPQVMSNYMFFKLQRHSDHHAYAYKPY